MRPSKRSIFKSIQAFTDVSGKIFFFFKKEEDLPEQGRSESAILIVLLPLQVLLMPGRDSLWEFTKADYSLQFSISILHAIIKGIMARFSTHLVLFLAEEVDCLYRYKFTPVFWMSIKQNTSKALLKFRGMAVLGRALGWTSGSFCSQLLHQDPWILQVHACKEACLQESQR